MQSAQLVSPQIPRTPRIGTSSRSVIRAKSVNDNFREDMVRCFNGEGGSIGFHGYLGKGGQLYSEWLNENHAYRSQVTLAEIELTTDSAGDLVRLCSNADSFLQVGASGSRGVYFTKIYPLVQAMITRRGNGQLDYRIADVSIDAFGKNEIFIKELGLPFTPKFVPGNFYASLKGAKDIDVIDVPGITFENPPFDAIKYSAEEILTYQLSYFRRSLKKGGVLIFSFANDDGIDAEGKALKIFYDDPLIHAYQKTIFQRVQNELSPTGNYDENNFTISHEWRPSQYVLTRHATTVHPMRFGIGRSHFDWEAHHDIYISNNTRYPEDMVKYLAAAVGYTDSYILGPPKSNPKSNMRVAALINC